MNRRFPSGIFAGALCVGLMLALGAVINAAGGQATQTTEDTGAGAQKFPLAAPAGVDSNAINQAPAGAVNQGPLDPSAWKYGHAFDAPPNAKIWNPVMIKMMKGEKVVGGTFFYLDDPEAYCAMANSGYYDFIWTEMQHSPRDWEKVGRMWAACPHAKAVPGVRVAYTNEREEQHAMDMGALVLVVPDGAFGKGRHRSSQLGHVSAVGCSQPGRRTGIQSRILGQSAGRLSRHHQPECGLDRDDRDPRWRQGC